MNASDYPAARQSSLPARRRNTWLVISALHLVIVGLAFLGYVVGNMHNTTGGHTSRVLDVVMFALTPFMPLAMLTPEAWPWNALLALVASSALYGFIGSRLWVRQ